MYDHVTRQPPARNDPSKGAAPGSTVNRDHFRNSRAARTVECVLIVPGYRRAQPAGAQGDPRGPLPGA